MCSTARELPFPLLTSFPVVFPDLWMTSHEKLQQLPYVISFHFPFITKILTTPVVSCVLVPHLPIPSSLLRPAFIACYRAGFHQPPLCQVSNYTPVSPHPARSDNFRLLFFTQRPDCKVTPLKSVEIAPFCVGANPRHVNKDECGTAKNTAEDRHSLVCAFCVTSNTICVEITKRSLYPFI